MVCTRVREVDALNATDYTHHIKSKVLAWGADLVGVADTEPLKVLDVDPPELLSGFTRVVSIAIKLPASVFETISDKPTPIYGAVYQAANRLLDEIAFKTAVALEKDGYRALPIPASQVLDRNAWQGAISHKAVARMAGLGWQGKSLLLITPEYGPRVRLVSVLTEATLDVDGPVDNRCGDCTQCRDACPAQAIKGVKTDSHYKNRHEALFFTRCVEQLTENFAWLPGVDAPICGICIKACPFGSKIKKRQKEDKRSREG